MQFLGQIATSIAQNNPAPLLDWNSGGRRLPEVYTIE
jgi:hypothetical protein